VRGGAAGSASFLARGAPGVRVDGGGDTMSRVDLDMLRLSVIERAESASYFM
jgi:hypothetical protein